MRSSPMRVAFRSMWAVGAVVKRSSEKRSRTSEKICSVVPWVEGPSSRRMDPLTNAGRSLLTGPTSTTTTAAAAGHSDRRLFGAVSTPARRGRPTVDRRSVLDEPNIWTERIAGEVLLARVAPELAGAQRRIAAHRQHRLVARVGLRPAREAREIVVALDDH